MVDGLHKVTRLRLRDAPDVVLGVDLAGLGRRDNRCGLGGCHGAQVSVLNRRTGCSQIRDPIWNVANTKPAAQLIAKCTAVMPQQIVIRALPLTLQHLDGLLNPRLRHVRRPHHQGLAIAVHSALHRRAREDSSAILHVAVTPFQTVRFDATMKGSGADGLQILVHIGDHFLLGHIVNVQRHHRRHAGYKAPQATHRNLKWPTS
mmetsp:Transcript_24611/g.69979  ORF Transcript_24611/g.69979 Transcript_24611/m.69979 type:complete len:204 (+) Transcript_24611:405-1016(+)